MEDEAIIALFFQRSEQAIDAFGEKYGRICYRVAYNVLNDRRDAEECVNDAYLSLWNAIPPAKPDPLSAFACKIVRNLSLKRYAQNTAAKRNSYYDVAMEELEDCLSGSATPEEEITRQELTKLLERFLDTLSRENRVIFLRRYWFADSYAEIAKRIGISEKNVSVRLTRIRKQLRDYFIQEEVL